MSAAAASRSKALFLDFDSTISVPYVVERLGDWCVADRQHIFDAMTAAELTQLFGPASRLAALKQLLQDLGAHAPDVMVFIVSLGRECASQAQTGCRVGENHSHKMAAATVLPFSAYLAVQQGRR